MKQPVKKGKRKINFLFFENADLRGLKERLTRILMFLFILFLPTQLGKHFFFPFSYLSGVRVDYLAPTLYLTDIILLILISLNHITIVNGFGKIKWIFIVGLINFLIAFSKPIALYYFLKVMELLAVFFIFKKAKISYRTILLAFTLGGLIEFFLSVSQIFYHRSLQGIFYFLGERYFTLDTPGVAKASFNGREILRPYGTFSHPNSMAGFYLLLYFFVLINKKFSHWLLLQYFSLFIFTSLVFVSFSKLAIVSFLILNIFSLIFYTKPYCRLCLVARLFTPVVVALIFLQACGDPLTLAKRAELLKNALIIISGHPVFGVGLGNYLLAQNQFVSKYPLFFNQPVHNIFLLFFAEVGIPLGGFILYKLFGFFKKNLFAICYLLFAILITGSFDHYWLTLTQNFLLMGVVFGLTINSKGKQS